MREDPANYYAPQLRLVLPRPVVIAGFSDCDAPAIGRLVSARTGLPFCEIDRQIEHAAGRSLAALVVDEGEGAVDRRAHAILERVSRQRPFGVIVLDRAWLPGPARSLLRERVELVHVRRGGVASGRGDERRAALLVDATMLLEAEDQHAHRLAEMLIDALEARFSPTGAGEPPGWPGAADD